MNKHDVSIYIELLRSGKVRNNLPNVASCPKQWFGTKFESYLQEAPAPRKPDPKEPEEKRIDLWSEE